MCLLRARWAKSFQVLSALRWPPGKLGVADSKGNIQVRGEESSLLYHLSSAPVNISSMGMNLWAINFLCVFNNIQFYVKWGWRCSLICLHNWPAEHKVAVCQANARFPFRMKCTYLYRASKRLRTCKAQVNPWSHTQWYKLALVFWVLPFHLFHYLVLSKQLVWKFRESFQS